MNKELNVDENFEEKINYYDVLGLKRNCTED